MKELIKIACVIITILFSSLIFVSCKKMTDKFYKHEQMQSWENVPKTEWEKVERMYFTKLRSVWRVESKDGLECIIMTSAYSDNVTCNWEKYNENK